MKEEAGEKADAEVAVRAAIRVNFMVGLLPPSQKIMMREERKMRQVLCFLSR